MADNIYLIGSQDELAEYKKNPNNIDLLPVGNLPMAYFPFFYSSSETSIEKMKRLFPLLENEEGTDASLGIKAEHNIDTDKLFSLLSILEESYQPYNNNNVQHITFVIIILWVFLLMMFLKIINYFFKSNYVYLISGAIIILLLISLTWAFVITGKQL